MSLYSLERIGTFEVLYADFTELLRCATGKAQLIPLLDHCTKVVRGGAVRERAVTTLVLDAWAAAKAVLRHLGRSLAALIVHHDQDPVFAGHGWTPQLSLRDRAWDRMLCEVPRRTRRWRR